MSRRLPPKTRFFYEQFVEFANPADPFGTQDLDRFYHFIWTARPWRYKYSETDIRQLLIKDGFIEDVAGELAEIFGNCEDFMRSRASLRYVSRDEWSA